MTSASILAIAKEVPLFAGMNNTEREWAMGLEDARRNGMIRSWRYEAVTLTLAPDCRYTPDFMVVETDGSIRFDETKGFWRDDAKVKIRLAARLFPEFRFTARRKRPKKEGGGWAHEDYYATKLGAAA